MRIYLDHNATTPLRDEVVEAMSVVLRESYGNPTSIHVEGARARADVEEARRQVADCLGVDAQEIFFTAGASEANNSVLAGLLELRGAGRRLITSQIEHPSVVEPACQLEKAGVPVTWLPVDSMGQVDPEAVLHAADSDAALVSLIWANNETGVIQPIETIAQALAERGIPLHVDATQAVGKWPVDLSRVPVSYLSCSAHKLNGPKGTGCLVAREGQSFRPLILGGPQERRRRGGTENVAGIVGFGVACDLARNELGARMRIYAELRDDLWELLQGRIEGIRRNGSETEVLPNTLNLEIP
ncbi:MAG: cysteine desulfurase family protein, partial [Myxococcota bacterium]